MSLVSKLYKQTINDYNELESKLESGMHPYYHTHDKESLITRYVYTEKFKKELCQSDIETIIFKKRTEYVYTNRGAVPRFCVINVLQRQKLLSFANIEYYSFSGDNTNLYFLEMRVIFSYDIEKNEVYVF